MVKIILTSASNGVIKRIVDDNINGAGSRMSITKLYPIDDGEDYAPTQSKELVEDLISDLGLDTGSDDSIVMKVSLDWGDDYVPSIAEVDDRIRNTSEQLKLLKELKSGLVQLAKEQKEKK